MTIIDNIYLPPTLQNMLGKTENFDFCELRMFPPIHGGNIDMAPRCLGGAFACTYTYERQPDNIFAKKINKIGRLDQKLQAFTLCTFQRYRGNFQAARASHHD